MGESEVTSVSLHQSFRDRRYFTGLDGLRCLAIFGVLFHHTPRLESFPTFLSRGYLGVDIFFTLSGFLIVTLLLREKARNGQISLKKFYIRKLIRILPVYYGLLLLLAVLYLLKSDGSDAQLFFNLLPSYLTFTSNWTLSEFPNLGVIWALATEMQFYLVWPLVEVFVVGPAKFMLLSVFMMFNILTSFGALDGFWSLFYGAGFDRSLEILQTTFTPICCGIILAHLLHHKSTFDAIAQVLSSRWASTMLFAMLAVLVVFSPISISSGGPYRLLTHIVIVMLLASLLVCERTPIHRVLNHQVLTEIGVVSYGVYLYHMFAFHIIRELSERIGLGEFGHFLVVLVLGSLLSILVAEVSFRFYEKPILKLKKRLS